MQPIQAGEQHTCPSLHQERRVAAQDVIDGNQVSLVTIGITNNALMNDDVSCVSNLPTPRRNPHKAAKVITSPGLLLPLPHRLPG